MHLILLDAILKFHQLYISTTVKFINVAFLLFSAREKFTRTIHIYILAIIIKWIKELHCLLGYILLLKTNLVLLTTKTLNHFG